MQDLKFKNITDHKLLLDLFNQNKILAQIIYLRVLRWDSTLATYSYDLEYGKGKGIVKADTLGHLPLKTPDCEINFQADALLLEFYPASYLHSSSHR